MLITKYKINETRLKASRCRFKVKKKIHEKSMSMRLIHNDIL